MIERYHHGFYPGLRFGRHGPGGASLRFLEFVSEHVKTPMPEGLQQLIAYYREHPDVLTSAERSASASRGL